MLNKKILMMIALLLVVPLLIAQEQKVPSFERGTNITLSVPCTIDGVYCNVSAVCQATIIDPDNIVLVNEATMTKNGGVFEVNLTSEQTDINGQYEFNIVCSQSDGSLSKFLTFHITPNGEMPSTAKGILYLGVFAILIIFFLLTIYGIIHSTHLVGRTLIFFMGWLLLIAISFIAWNMSLNFITSTPFLVAFLRLIFLFFLIGTFPLIVVAFVWVGYMMLTMKDIEGMMERGIPMDEAIARKKGGRF